MMRRALIVLAVVASALSAGSSLAEQERPPLEILGSDGQLCVQVYLDEFAPVVCVPVPN